MNRFFYIVYILCALIWFSSLEAMSKTQASVPIEVQNIGVRTLEYFDEKRQRPILVEFWYPTDQAMQDPIETAKEESVWVHPVEIRNSPLSERSAKYPLILMSHGHKGDRRERSWLAEHFAKNGFAVAAVEHYGNTFANYNPLISIRFWERPKDITFALDSLLADPLLGVRIDSAKVGFVGYSMGGMTGLALGGAIAKNVKEVALRQQGQKPEVTSEMIEQTDFSESGNNYGESRIKAMLLICPANFVYPAKSLKRIKVPTALVATVADEVLPHKEHALQIVRYLSSLKMQMMNKNASHYTFLNRVSDLGKKIFQKNSLIDPPGCDRLSIHHKVGAFAVQFFKEQLY